MSTFWLVIQYFGGLHSHRIELHPLLGILWYVFAFVLLYFSLKQLRSKQDNEYLDFWQGVQSVTMVAVMSVPMHLILYTAYYSTLGSVFFESAITFSAQIGLPTDEAEQYFNLPALLVRETLGIISSGFIISLLSSMFLKSS